MAQLVFGLPSVSLQKWVSILGKYIILSLKYDNNNDIIVLLFGCFSVGEDGTHVS